MITSNEEKVIRAFELVNSLIEEYSKNMSEDLALFIEAEKRFGADWKSKPIKSNLGSVNIKEYPCYYSVKKDTLVNAFGNVLYRKGTWAKEQDSYKPMKKCHVKKMVIIKLIYIHTLIMTRDYTYLLVVLKLKQFIQKI